MLINNTNKTHITPFSPNKEDKSKNVQSQSFISPYLSNSLNPAKFQAMPSVGVLSWLNPTLAHRLLKHWCWHQNETTNATWSPELHEFCEKKNMGIFGKITIHKPLKIGQFPKRTLKYFQPLRFRGYIYIYRYVRFTGRITS